MKQEIINGIEKIISKYYFKFNTEETREALENEVRFFLRTYKLGCNISYKDVDMDTNNNTLTVLLED